MNQSRVEIVDGSDLPAQAFNFDIARIRSRLGRLFPFTERLSLSSAAEGDGKDHHSREGLYRSELGTPSIPLALSDAEMQAVLDASWSRRQRWDSFQQILALVQQFDPQQGDVSILLRRYSRNNLLQPFHASQNPEPRVWGLLSVAADHFEFVQFITSFVGRIPSSKATTELLFLLDKLVQANLTAVLSLLRLDTIDGIGWTRSVSPNGAEVLVALHMYYERALSQRSLWDEAALTRRYDEVRVGILEHLIRTTPQSYRVNDARFLIGEIYWHQGRWREARETWDGITPDADDECFIVYSEVRASIAGEIIDRARIDVALNEQAHRWTQASFQRLHQFGFRFDTF